MYYLKLASAFLNNGEVFAEVGRPYIKEVSNYGMFELINKLV